MIENFFDGFAFNVEGQFYFQKITCGGEGVLGANRALGVERQIDAAFDAGADGDPGDVSAARVVGAVGFAGAAVVGADDQQRLVHHAFRFHRIENFSDAPIGVFNGGDLLGRAPPRGMADVIDLRQMDE